jgi:Helix-turn-helix domain/WD40-like Beta Propeller Repeat
MLTDETRISLADLSTVGVRLRATDAVTIVRELLLQVSRGELPGVPSAHVIRLTGGGAIVIEGPVAAGGGVVSRGAQLLDSLLPPFDATGELKVPGALRLVVARALGTLDLPAYTSLEEFGAALDRFAEADARLAVRRLVERHGSSRGGHPTTTGSALVVAPEDSASRQTRVPETALAEQRRALMRRDPSMLSVSDIRRARRATGLPLSTIADRSRIPVTLLRQLEWGYVVNWPAGLYGRTELVRYARAAGLDEQLVIATVWPLLEQAEHEREREALFAAASATAPPEVEAHTVTEPLPDAVVEAVDVRPVPQPEVALGEILLGPPVTLEPASEAPRRRFARRAVAAAGLVAAAALAAIMVLPGVQEQVGTSPKQFTSSQSESARSESKVASDVPSAPAQPAPQDAPAATSGNTSEPANETVTASHLPQPSGAPSVPTNGAEPVRGLTEAETAWSPSFASVGSAMFYHAQEGRDGDSAVVRADTDGSGTILRITRIVDDTAQNFHARPSPDGSQIAFDSNRDGERGVYVANADGSNVRRVSGEGFAAVPSWSPDGGTLAFVRAEPERPNVWNLWTLELSSGDLRRLTSYRYGQPWGGSWFPDGQRIAYSHEDRLVVLDLESGDERVYTSPRKGRLLRTPAVSPDGRKIIFQLHRDGAWLLDVEDGSMRKVLADPSAEEYSWSPDGRRVAYHSRQSGTWGVWLMSGR